MKGSFAVIGLGRFGISVAKTLTGAGFPVLVIDAKQEAINEIAPEVDAAVCLDTTDKEALLEIDIGSYSCVIVGIGSSSLESSILTTALLQQIGVPRIIARAIHDLHGKVLLSVGAHEIVNPEAEIGQRVGNRLANPYMIEQFSLGEAVRLAEVEVTSSLIDKDLLSLDLRNRFDISVVAIRRGNDVIVNPKASETLRESDLLVVIGSNQSVTRFAHIA